MTITNYTFFSPNGTEFPVSSNADGKLYMMLTGMELNSYRIKHWEAPIDTALNRQYKNTSVVLAGRYFELADETVVLSASSTNYIHANIDLANALNPVSISVEQADNSTDVDINNKSGVIKHCFDIVQTDTSTVTSSQTPDQVTTLNKVNLPSGEVFGISLNNGWYEEKIGDNYYRWTRIFTVGANIAAATGSLYNSDTLNIPAAPTGATNTNRTVTISTAPWPCWTGYFATAGGFRLFSTVVRSYGQVTLEAVLYGSKS